MICHFRQRRLLRFSFIAAAWLSLMRAMPDAVTFFDCCRHITLSRRRFIITI